MPLLMHIGFDNSFRLKRRAAYYLEYRGVRFKLIQNNPRKWADVLLTIVPDDDRAEQQRVYAIAGEFLSAFSWENRSAVAIQIAGGMSVPYGFPLQRVKCRAFVFPKIPFGGNVGGGRISNIPEIETEDQRKALVLFREALSSNKVWLSILFYWQILEITGGKPEEWIDRVYPEERRIYISEEDLRHMPLGSRTLGEYLRDDCRHAIAHIRRRRGSRALKFDVSEENMRMRATDRALRILAEHYIGHGLGLKKRLHLVRRRGTREFPTYVDTAALRRYPSVLAYP